jgi:hypothetical protein
MPKSPTWLASIVESNVREKMRLRNELGTMRGAIELLMKPRNGEKWNARDREELLKILRSASSVSPYLVVLALPGSVMILPLLAWRLDVRRNRRTALSP